MPKTWLIGGGTFIIALLVVSIILALTQEEADFPEDSPERAVQLYLTALSEEDYQTAYRLLSMDLTQECSSEKFASGLINSGRSQDNRIVLEETKLLGEDSVVVIVRETRVEDSAPFGVSESSNTRDFTLRLESGQWRLTQINWPFYSCRVAESVFPAPPAPNLAPIATSMQSTP